MWHLVKQPGFYVKVTEIDSINPVSQLMTIREIAISKLQQLPDPALSEVSEFIDFVMYKHQVKSADSRPPEDIAKAWAKWFEEVNQLKVLPNHQDKSETQH